MKTACNLIKLVLFNQISIKTNKSGQNRLAIDIFTIKIPFWCYLSNQRTEGTDGEQNTELMTNCIYSEVCCTGDGALASESRGPSFFICILPPLYRLSTYDIVISNIYLQNYTYKWSNWNIYFPWRVKHHSSAIEISSIIYVLQLVLPHNIQLYWQKPF
mgnify:CR=1 FL=1